MSGQRVTSRRCPLPRWAVPVVAVIVLGTTAAIGWLLWQWIGGLDLAAPVEKDRAAAQLDVVKIAASIAVGGGGLFALYLAARRQRTQEEELAYTEHDAAARRVTELYTKSVEQLGSDKAPVRLGRALRPGTSGPRRPAPAADSGQRAVRLPAHAL